MQWLLILGALVVLSVPAVAASEQDKKNCVISSDDSDKAIPACTAIIEDKKTKTKARAIAYLTRGSQFRWKQNADRAITDFGEAIRLDPTSDDYSHQYYSGRADAYKLKGDYERAIADYTASIRLQSDWTKPNEYRRRGEIYLEKGDFDKAIADYDWGVRRWPKEYGGYTYRAKAYALMGDYDRAFADFDQALRIKPNQDFSYYERAQIYEMKGDLDRAITDFDQAIRLGGSYYIDRAKAYEKKGDIGRAAGDYDAAVRAYGSSVGHRGEFYERKGDLNRAISDYDEAIRLRPDNLWEYLSRARAYTVTGQHGEANADLDAVVRLCDRLVREGPDHWCYRMRGAAYLEKGEYLKANADFEERIGRAPFQSETYVLRGRARNAVANHDGAVSDFDQAIRVQAPGLQKVPSPYAYRGEAYEKKGLTTLAIENYRQALATPESLEIDERKARDVARKNLDRLLAPKQPAAAAVTSPAASAPADTGRRVALVIGNSTYKHAGELANPTNDAADMATELKKLGFEIIEGTNLDKAAMDRKIRDFAATLTGADAGIFFYAGHGLQVGGINYLVPIDAQMTTATALDFEMVRLDVVQRTMERETKTNILFLDACRDNPLARDLARAMGTRSGEIGRGLAAAESGVGTLISYSTQPGNVALDGTGRNSPFAGALVKHIATPGEDLSSILINVRTTVMQVTANKQVPWEHSALTRRFYFAAAAPAAPR